MRYRLRPYLLGLVLAALTVAAFVAYLRPEFIVSLANQIWLCF